MTFLRRSPLLVLIVVAVAIFGLLRPDFLGITSFLAIGQQIAVTAVLAFAMTAVIVARGIDISVGSTLSVSGMVGAYLLTTSGWPVPLAVAACVLTGAAIGALNGVLIGMVGVSPLVATLGTMAFGSGAALAVADASSIAVDDTGMLLAGGSYVGPVPSAVLIAIVVMLGWMLVFGRTLYGRWIYAVGGNLHAARASLVPARSVQLSTFVLTGASAGLGAVMLIGRVGSAQPLAGEGMEFAAITAAVVGGAKLSGGVGTIGGTALGAVFVGVINAGLSFLQVPQQTMYIINGVLVILAVLATQRAELQQMLASLRRAWRSARVRPRAASVSSAATPTTEPTAPAEWHEQDAPATVAEPVAAPEPAVPAWTTTSSTPLTPSTPPEPVAPHRRLELVDLGKSFPGVRALHDVSFGISSGEVVALVGENGAGKSTLVKALAGAQEPDEGMLLVDGVPTRVRTPEEARERGISVIHQHFSLVPDLTVAENLFLGREPTRFGGLHRRRVREEARRVLAELDLEVDIDAPVAGLQVGERQLVEVAKAMLDDAWLVIMDEPTSALTNRERDRLYAVIGELLERGVAVLYISHRLEEVFALADRVVVLRDGGFVGAAPTAELDESTLISMMVGRDVASIFPHRTPEVGAPLLELDGLGDGGRLEEATLYVRAGEIVGLAGLMGSGRSEVLRCAAGLSRHLHGTVRVNGVELAPGDVAGANRLGVAYVPEDRLLEGIVPQMSVRDNIILAWLRRHARGGLLPSDAGGVVQAAIDRLSIRPPYAAAEAGTLSGGNQQKVVLARWLATEPRVLLLDEPTVGVDVGAKAEIHRLVAGLVDQGIGVLLISSELPELLGVADRVYVMHAGRLVDELAPDATEEEVMELAFGQRAPA